MARRIADSLNVVEAAYEVDLPDDAWLAGILAAARPALDAGLGVEGYFFDASGGTMQMWGHRSDGCPLSRDRVLRTARRIDPSYVAASWLARPCSTASEVAGFARVEPLLQRAFRGVGVKDFFAVSAVDASGMGCGFDAPLPVKRRVSSSERATWSRIAAHVASGLRLRRRLAAQAAAPAAVLTPSGRTVHAEGDAVDAREMLRHATITVERARGALRRSDPVQALESWPALLRGRWTLVDMFESDGKRFVVAHANRPVLAPHERLTDRECQVLTYAARGHSNKLIAYELGISASTVRVLLARASRRLGVHGRAPAVAKWQAWLKLLQGA